MPSLCILESKIKKEGSIFIFILPLLFYLFYLFFLPTWQAIKVFIKNGGWMRMEEGRRGVESKKN